MKFETSWLELLASSSSQKMPALFIGHGNPMHAITKNEFADSWEELGKRLGEHYPRPKAVLCISAHWLSDGEIKVDISRKPRTVHDFGGFPQALYEMQYPASGAPEIAEKVTHILQDDGAVSDTSWGYDHGCWTVLNSIYPAADIPVFQMSLNMRLGYQSHVELGQKLRPLREEGVLILASGNIVHNLAALRMDGIAHDWAIEFDQYVADFLKDGDVESIIALEKSGSRMRLAHPTDEHFIPLLYLLGLIEEQDRLAFLTEKIDLGAASMRSVVIA